MTNKKKKMSDGMQLLWGSLAILFILCSLVSGYAAVQSHRAPDWRLCPAHKRNPGDEQRCRDHIRADRLFQRDMEKLRKISGRMNQYANATGKSISIGVHPRRKFVPGVCDNRPHDSPTFCREKFVYRSAEEIAEITQCRVVIQQFDCPM